MFHATKYNCLKNRSQIVDAITTPASNRRTNLLTEIASPTLCLQPRSPRIICTDSCLYERTVRTLVKETCGDLRTSRFWALWPNIPSGRCLESNAKQNSDWLAWVTLSFMRFPGDLTPPIDTYLHVSRREVNQNPVTNSGLKQGLVVLAAQAYQYGDETSYPRLRLRPFALVIRVTPLQIIILHVFNIASCVQDRVIMTSINLFKIAT